MNNNTNNIEFSQCDMSMISSSQGQKVILKLQSKSVTKRVRQLPETYQLLRQQIHTQLCKGKDQEMDHVIQQNLYSISYEDDTGDTINVSDDEDLQAAYEVSENTPSKQLKLKINPRLGLAIPKNVSPANQAEKQEEQKQEQHQKEAIASKEEIIEQQIAIKRQNENKGDQIQPKARSPKQSISPKVPLANLEKDKYEGGGFHFEKVGRKTWDETEQYVQALGGRLLSLDEVRQILAVKANVPHYAQAYFQKRKYGDNVPLIKEDIWVAVTDFTTGKDWVQVGTTNQHYLGKSHVNDCGGYPSWGDSKPSYANNQLYIMWKSCDSLSSLKISDAQQKQIYELIKAIDHSDRAPMPGNYSVGAIQDMTSEYLVEYIKKGLQSPQNGSFEFFGRKCKSCDRNITQVIYKSTTDPENVICSACESEKQRQTFIQYNSKKQYEDDVAEDIQKVAEVQKQSKQSFEMVDDDEDKDKEDSDFDVNDFLKDRKSAVHEDRIRPAKDVIPAASVEEPNNKVDEVKLYKTALQIFEGKKYKCSFEQIISVLRKSGGQTHIAIQTLNKENQKLF